MAVNALGQNIQLLLSPAAPGADPALALKAGDLLQARIVELLPDGKAVISLKGLNLLAQLPQAQPGQNFQRGTQLDLAVLQSNASNPSQPALTLKLTGFSGPAQGGGAPAPQLGPSAAPPLPRQGAQELLAQAKLPATAANVQTVQSLSRYGLPLDPPTLHAVLGGAQALLEVEAPLPSPPQAGLPEPFQAALREARTQVQVLLSQPSQAPHRPQLQSLERQINSLLEGSRPAPTQPEALLSQLRAATAQLSAPGGTGLPALNRALAVLRQAPAAPPAPPQTPQTPQTPQPSPQATLPDAAAVGGVSVAPPPHVAQAFQRELAAALQAQLAPALTEAPLTPQRVAQALAMMRADAEAPGSALLGRVADSVARQLPQAQLPADPVLSRPLLLQALSEFESAFQSLPLERPIPSLPALQAALEARGLASPGEPLSALPREAVQEALAFLRARELPPLRPAVEAVAQELASPGEMPRRLQALAEAAPRLPQGFLELNPGLKRALDGLADYVARQSLDPQRGLDWTQLRDAARGLGLDMEAQLAAGGDPSSTLKAKLHSVADAAARAQSDPAAQASPSLARQLEGLAGEARAALNTLHSLSLGSQPTPAFDVSTVQLPVMLGGQLQSGQLSVYWRKGRAHELSASEPVNVVFLLNTRALGEVKVQLQVWKDECRCKVTLGSEELRGFVAEEAPALAESFRANTRFKLSSLEVSAGAALAQAVQAALGGLEGGGLNLSA